MDLKEIGKNMRNKVDSAQDRNYWRALVNVVLSLLSSVSLRINYYCALQTKTCKWCAIF